MVWVSVELTGVLLRWSLAQHHTPQGYSGKGAGLGLTARALGAHIEAQRLQHRTLALLRSRPNPLQPGEAAKLQQARPVGAVPRPSTEPIRVQRRASNTGVIMVAGQQVALGPTNRRTHRDRERLRDHA